MAHALLYDHLLHTALVLAHVQLAHERLRRCPRHKLVLLATQHQDLLPAERVLRVGRGVRCGGGVVAPYVREEGVREVGRRDGDLGLLRAGFDQREIVGAAWYFVVKMPYGFVVSSCAHQ